MKKFILLLIVILMTVTINAQMKVKWVSSTKDKQWRQQMSLTTAAFKNAYDVEINLNNPLQKIDGFGTCFNELGWTSLSILNLPDRESIFNELFKPGVGANFTICRMPVGANDFSRDWYSYNETDGDFSMKNFSIANDKETLIPFIKNALQYNPALTLWASPWSPPSWMKYNKHYALRKLAGKLKDEELKSTVSTKVLDIGNGLKIEQEGKEGQDLFIQEDQYFKAYSLYFEKFINSYKAEGIDISMVMPQNEFNSAQPFPSCTWTAKGLSKFISYLGPQMEAQKVAIFFGTMERPNEKLVDSVLINPQSSPFIKGAGFQWAGKDAIAGIHQRYPNLTLYQTEQECGDGKNDWQHCLHAWDLMKLYINSGANGYMYWNTSLQQGGISTWGWQQNSLISVNTIEKTYNYNYEYYLLKHVSHFVQPGAKLLSTSGGFKNLLAFINTDKSVVIVARNNSEKEKRISIKIGNKIISPSLEPDSFNTFLLAQD